MEASMTGVKSESKLIFPEKPYIEKNIPDLTNKYVAIFNSLEQAKARAMRSEINIKECWQSICNDVLTKIIHEYAESGDIKILSSIWDRQTNPDTFFEIFWVIVEGDPTQYADWLDRAQMALDARKQLRHVKLLNDGEQEIGELNEPGEKSTISGEREALRGVGTSRDAVRTFWANLAQNLESHHINHGISPNGEERLDAIDTVKRFAYLSEILEKKVRDASFPSTSSVATATFVEAVFTRDMSIPALKDWLDITNRLAFMQTDTIPFLSRLAEKYPLLGDILKRDGDCYFPETFMPQRLKKDYSITSISQAEDIAARGRSALKKLLSVTDDLGITRPTPYYAMIQMDGDKMGKLLSGVKDESEHGKISEALSYFSRQLVPSTVEDQYPGRLIYAGGDDVFALAPLARDDNSESSPNIKTVLDLVKQLQQEYCDTVRAQVNDDKRRQDVTASTGIAFAHHFTSLSYVRRMSKAAEDRAKKHYGRNALVVTVLRRSGEQTQVGCRWHYKQLSEEGQPIPLFTSFYELFKQDVLSPKCVYILLEEAPTLVILDKVAQQSEIRRVMNRQCNDKNKLDVIAEMAGHLAKLTEAMDSDEKPFQDEKFGMSVELHSDRRRYGLVEVLGWLLVMVFLARKEQD